MTTSNDSLPCIAIRTAFVAADADLAAITAADVRAVGERLCQAWTDDDLEGFFGSVPAGLAVADALIASADDMDRPVRLDDILASVNRF